MAGISHGMAASRAARLRCPRCGEGPLFRGLLAMHHGCSQCGFVYQRDPGYFLGSTYINYGFTSLTLTVMYIVLHFGYGLSNQLLAAPPINNKRLRHSEHDAASWESLPLHLPPNSFEVVPDDVCGGRARDGAP